MSCCLGLVKETGWGGNDIIGDVPAITLGSFCFHDISTMVQNKDFITNLNIIHVV